jgi:D-xylose transport system substrate-binding protein
VRRTEYRPALEALRKGGHELKKLIISLAAGVLVVGLSVGGAFAQSEKQAATGGSACVLLPDTKSSVRWETQDRPTFVAAFKKAGVPATVVNAENDAQRQRSQADQCLANGAKVILLTSLDSGSGCAIITAAKARGARVIDYDRLNTGCKGADYYVSFNNTTVGKFMGQGVKAAMTAKGLLGSGKKPVIAYLNGGPTDNNSKLFKNGYAGVLDPLIKSGKAAKGPDQGVPAWDNQKARTIFEQMLVQTSNKIDAVAAANDGLANAVVTALKAKKLKPIPLSGQDATSQGAQNIISGWQSGTVYKPAKIEANAAAAIAVALLKGQQPRVNGTTNNGVRNVPSSLSTPIWITKKNINLLYKDGQLKKSEVCVGSYKQYC